MNNWFNVPTDHTSIFVLFLGTGILFDGSFSLWVSLNPPFSWKLTSNVTIRFFNLLDLHFPKSSKLQKTFNRNTVKVSYYCTENLSSTIKIKNAIIYKRTIALLSLWIYLKLISYIYIIYSELNSTRITKIFYGRCSEQYITNIFKNISVKQHFPINKRLYGHINHFR